MKELTKPRNRRQEIWDALRDNREKFLTVKELAEITDSKETTVYAYLKSLFRGGFIGVQQGFVFSRALGYRLERDAGAEAPRLKPDGTPCKGTATEAMWRTMKILKTFDFDALIANVNMTHKLTRATAKRYTKALEDAGYLVNIGSARHKTFKLVKNTGSQPPMLLAVKEVFDPNINEIVLREVPDYE